MLLQKFTKTLVFLTFAISLSAAAQNYQSGAEATAAVAESEVTTIQNGGGWNIYYQCSAHSTHNEWAIYYGQPSYFRQQAQSSAIHECEHHEHHTCEIHECRLVQY